MKVLLLDTETTGLDPAKDACIEVACCVFDLALGVPLESYSSLIRADRNEAFEVNGIPVAALSTAQPAAAVWRNVAALSSGCDAFVAHRAEFDHAFTAEWVRSSHPWVCSKFDLKWPRGKVGDGLVHLALAHGLGVAHAHRAMSDVDTLSRLFTRAKEMGEDLRAMLEHGMRPKKKYQALVTFDEKDKAKQAGFQWEAESKRWLRTMACDDVAALPFRVQVAA